MTDHTAAHLIEIAAAGRGAHAELIEMTRRLHALRKATDLTAAEKASMQRTFSDLRQANRLVMNALASLDPLCTEAQATAGLALADVGDPPF